MQTGGNRERNGFLIGDPNKFVIARMLQFGIFKLKNEF